MAALSSSQLIPYAVPALVALVAYRRIRRNFGLQPWRPVRMGIRLALLGLVTLLLAVAAVMLPNTAPAVAGGLAAGLVLGGFGLRHTHAEWRDGRGWYTPNPWIGLALTALLLGRLAWRFLHSGVLAQPAQASPLTLGLAALLLGYSLAYGIGLVLRMRRLQAGAAH